MHITIEKALGIAISLSLCAGIGIPLLNLTFNIYSDYQNYDLAINLMTRLDHGINTVLNNNTDYLDTIDIPEEFILWSSNNSIFCKFSEQKDGTIQNTYSSIIILEPPKETGNNLVYMYKEENSIIIKFIKPAN